MELMRIEEELHELRRAWLPEPGESLALRMHSEAEVARTRAEAAKLWERLDAVRTNLNALKKDAEEYLLPTHEIERLREWANRLQAALVEFNAALG